MVMMGLCVLLRYKALLIYSAIDDVQVCACMYVGAHECVCVFVRVSLCVCVCAHVRVRVFSNPHHF